MDNEDIYLSELAAGVLRRWRLVASVILVSICLVAIRLWVVVPQYEARVQLIVLAPDDTRIDFQTLQLYRNLVPTYKEILSSRRVSDAVIDELELGWSQEEYRRRVRITANEEAQTLTLFVRSHSPDDAMRIANGAAQVMIEIADAIMREERLVVLDPAVKPEKPVKPRPLLEFAIAMALGLTVGTMVSIILDRLDRRIRDEASVERRLGLPVLGVIPHIDR